jgi:hypothetical protein
VNVIALDPVHLTSSDSERFGGFDDDAMATLGFRKGDEPIGGDPDAESLDRAMRSWRTRRICACS